MSRQMEDEDTLIIRGKVTYQKKKIIRGKVEGEEYLSHSIQRGALR